VFDPWSLNGTPEEYKGRRLMQGFLYVRSCKADNEYAHPLDMCPLVDLNLGKVRLLRGGVGVGKGGVGVRNERATECVMLG
jgi:Cu2+-containing amine oxidase